ncbi:hypothetical protein SAMN00790413_02951 [Deinococcus hopiensis KR-140]|uniref:Uncharacterized protein n=1 Tax=Deinococcus hopiensis KR-140 TaxID=695939 RepID=A0A1W1VR22_9DEIO|nr:hypothetical protein SAMN00790413_02951 [Deinococcus hopiensis KR-140]
MELLLAALAIVLSLLLATRQERPAYQPVRVRSRHR